MDDKCAHDWLPRSAHMSSHVQRTEAEEGRAAQTVTEHTHTQLQSYWLEVFSCMGALEGAVYVGTREELSSSIA